MVRDKWIKSSSCDSGSCVEVGTVDGETVAIRITGMPEQILYADRDEWLKFIEGAKAGEFDLE
jgi:hypothetical protein